MVLTLFLKNGWYTFFFSNLTKTSRLFCLSQSCKS